MAFSHAHASFIAPASLQKAANRLGYAARKHRIPVSLSDDLFLVLRGSVRSHTVACHAAPSRKIHTEVPKQSGYNSTLNAHATEFVPNGLTMLQLVVHPPCYPAPSPLPSSTILPPPQHSADTLVDGSREEDQVASDAQSVHNTVGSQIISDTTAVNYENTLDAGPEHASHAADYLPDEDLQDDASPTRSDLVDIVVRFFG